MKTVVAFGEILARLAPEGVLRFRQCLPGSLNVTFGGAEANVAASLAQLGAPVRLVSALPDHLLADAAVAFYRGLGVETSQIVRRTEGRLGLYFYENGIAQRPGQVIYDREHSAICLTDENAYDWDAIYADAGAVYVSGITPGLSETASRATIRAAAEAKKRGVQVFCDLNFRRKLWRWRPGTDPSALAREVLPELLLLTDVLIANDGSAADVFEIRCPGSQRKSSLEAARELKALFPGLSLIAMTLRENLSASHNRWGAFLYDSTGAAHFAPQRGGEFQPYEMTPIVDRVGGGDAFGAALIYALHTPELSTPDQAIAFAAAAACLAHTVVGDVNFMSRAEAEALMRGSGDGRVVR